MRREVASKYQSLFVDASQPDSLLSYRTSAIVESSRRERDPHQLIHLHFVPNWVNPPDKTIAPVVPSPPRSASKVECGPAVEIHSPIQGPHLQYRANGNLARGPAGLERASPHAKRRQLRPRLQPNCLVRGADRPPELARKQHHNDTLPGPQNHGLANVGRRPGRGDRP